ncbi:MAG: hypothetical protein ACREHG_08235, partial [Candidatus Saccharimonadales bacterium]
FIPLSPTARHYRQRLPPRQGTKCKKMLVRQGLRETFTLEMRKIKDGKSVTWESHFSKHIKYEAGGWQGNAGVS